MKYLYAGVDVGGSHISVSLVNKNGLILESYEIIQLIDGELIETDELVKMIVSCVEKLLLRFIEEENCVSVTLKAIGIGCPGQCTGGVVISTANLKKVRNVPLASLVSTGCQLKSTESQSTIAKAMAHTEATLVNDADAAVCGEIFGQPEKYSGRQHLAMFTLGTGIGCGLILNGKLHQGAHGLIEAGHCINLPKPMLNIWKTIDGQDNTPYKCGCGQIGCVETYGSAASAVRRMNELEKSVGRETFINNGKELFAAAAAGDALAERIIDETAAHLALLVLNVIRVVDVDTVIFGGGLAGAGDALLGRIRHYLQDITWTVLATDVAIVAATSQFGPTLGAALAARNNFPVSATVASDIKPTPSQDKNTICTYSSLILALGLGTLLGWSLARK